MRFVSPLLRTTSQSKGEPAIQIKWLNSLECYALSVWRMPSWFVLISEYKSMENKAKGETVGFPDYGSVQHSLTTVLYDTTDVVFPALIHHWPSVWRTHERFTTSPTVSLLFLILRSREQTEPNLLHIRNDLPLLPLSAPSKPITRQIIFGDEKSPLPLLLLL